MYIVCILPFKKVRHVAIWYSNENWDLCKLQLINIVFCRYGGLVIFKGLAKILA